MKNADTINLKDLAAEKTESGQVQHLRQQIKTLGGHIKALNEKLGETEEFAQQIAGAVVAAEPFSAFHYRRAVRGAAEVSAVLKLSDWHIGEVVQGKEVEDFNRYDWALAQDRIFNIVSDFLKWVEVQRAAYRIDECAIFAEGDYVSGDIHGELLATNEFPLPVQTANAGHLLGEVLRRLSSHFKRLNVFMVGADNHGRLTRKPQAKQKTSNNMSYLVHALARSYASNCTNIRFVEAEGMKLLAEVNGFKFLIEHGDTVRGWAGFPYYGFGRTMGKEAQRRMNSDRGFHYWSIAHFHVPAIIDGKILVNGSLSGTSEFDHACSRHALPSQVAFLVSRHGIFNWVPFTGGREPLDR